MQERNVATRADCPTPEQKHNGWRIWQSRRRHHDHPHFGIGGEADFRFKQGAYAGLNYRPAELLNPGGSFEIFREPGTNCRMK